MNVEFNVVDDPAAKCAATLSAAAGTGQHVILTGGTTPRRAYELSVERHAAAWEGASVWLSDDRCVPPDDALSNYRMVKEALLDPLRAVGVEVEHCHRILCERGPEKAAMEYERELEIIGDGPGAIRFELALIGIGSDGHICSMFPGQDSLHERSRLAVGVPVAGLEPFVPRVTLTFAALNRTRHVLVLATGAGKADAVAAAFADDAPATTEVPASLLREHVEEITVLLDEEAAARL